MSLTRLDLRCSSRHRRRIVFALLMGLAAAFLAGVTGDARLRAAESSDAAGARFATEVRPLLVQHCLKCHGGEKTKGGFDLSTARTADPRIRRRSSAAVRATRSARRG